MSSYWDILPTEMKDKILRHKHEIEMKDSLAFIASSRSGVSENRRNNSDGTYTIIEKKVVPDHGGVCLVITRKCKKGEVYKGKFDKAIFPDRVFAERIYKIFIHGLCGNNIYCHFYKKGIRNRTMPTAGFIRRRDIKERQRGGMNV